MFPNFIHAAKPQENVVTTETVEQEIVRKGLTAPRVTPADIAANIASEHYFTAAEGVKGEEFVAGRPQHTDVPESLKLLTICVLVLRNGFVATGKSACASPENFNAELGKRVAREDALREVWPVMGYELRERLYRERQAGEAHVRMENEAHAADAGHPGFPPGHPGNPN